MHTVVIAIYLITENAANNAYICIHIYSLRTCARTPAHLDTPTLAHVMTYPPTIHSLTKTLAVDGTRPKCRFCEFTFRRIRWAKSHPGNSQVPPECACVAISRSYRNVNFEPTNAAEIFSHEHPRARPEALHWRMRCGETSPSMLCSTMSTKQQSKI